MGDPNSSDSLIVHYKQMIHGTDTMFEDCEMMLGSNEMADDCQIISGDTMGHGGEMILDYKVVDIHDNKTAHDSNMFPGIFAYSFGSKMAGTSHLKRHITLGHCPVIKGQEPSAGGTDNGGQGTIVKPSKRSHTCAGYGNASFNPDLSSSYLAKMIILHDYPLHVVQQPTFISFIEGLQPHFKVVNTDAMEAEVYAIYLNERDNLLKEVGNIPGRINLTI